MNYKQNKKEHENENENKNKKKGRVVWSVELHHKFVAAVNQLGVDKALPKKILDLMNDEKLTKENVSSHLQKYRLHLKRISSSVAHQQKGSGQFPTSGMNTPVQNTPVQNVHELPSSARNQFGQNKITNDQLNFQSSIACHDHHNGDEVIPISEWFTNQCPHSLTDMHSQLGVLPSNVPFEWWDDNNQDAIYHSNVIGAVDPEGNTSTNSILNSNLDFTFCDLLHMRDDGIMESTEENSSLNQHQVHIMNQHKPKNSCIATNVDSPEYLVTVSSSSSSQGSQVSAEIAKMRQEMVATRNENHQLREMVQAMMAQQDMLMQAVLQVIPPSTISPSKPRCSLINRSCELTTSFPDIH